MSTPESSSVRDVSAVSPVAGSPNERRSTFRPEIQALRAIAVTAVVLYHLWPASVPGGFIGVDVFFVISGFLITQHLLQELRSQGRVSLTRFWARRIRRLMPAAYLVLAVCLGLLVVMHPVTWTLNLAEIRASAGYVENWLLGFNAIDYLAAENSPSLVQHYWSLAVEEQFYLVWPLLIVGAAFVGRRTTSMQARIRRVRVVLTLIFVVSLLSSIILTPRIPALAFFATPLRAWQFAAGGLLSFLLHDSDRRPGHGARAALSWAGWVGIAIASLVLPGTRLQFPGWIALLPVACAAAVLYAGDPRAAWSPRRAIVSRPVQWVGEYSYSIYLWHWPLIIAAPWILGVSLTWPDKFGILIVTGLLAYATKRWVEDPVRTGAWWRVRRRRAYGFAAVCTVVLVAVTTVWSLQLSSIWKEKDAQSQRELASGQPCYAVAALLDSCTDPFVEPDPMDVAFAAADFDPALSRCQQPAAGTNPVFCYFGAGDGASRTVAVVGNSHALRLIPALEAYGKAHNWRIILAAKTDCLGPVVTGLGPELDDCRGWSDNVRQQLIARGDVDAVVFGSHVGAKYYLAGPQPTAADVDVASAGVVDTFVSYRDAGIRVMVTGDVPGTRPFDAPACVAASQDRDDPCARPRASADIPNLLSDIARAHPELVNYLPLADFTCDAETCHAVIGGVVVYSDSHHLTTAFSRSLAPYLGSALDELLAEPRPGT